MFSKEKAKQGSFSPSLQLKLIVNGKIGSRLDLDGYLRAKNSSNYSAYATKIFWDNPNFILFSNCEFLLHT